MPQGLSGVRVLVCDDDEDARELLAAVLSAEGASVCTAASRSGALDAFREWSPHVLVSDVGMPDVDGYEFIGQVRAMTEDEGGQIPAIALRAHARPDDELNALVAGYQAHVVKPVDPLGSCRWWGPCSAVRYSETESVPETEGRTRPIDPPAGQSAGASRQDRKEARARDVGRNLVQGSPVRPHDLPRDEGTPFRRAESLDQKMHLAAPTRDTERDRSVGAPLERLGDEIGDRLGDAIGVPFAVELAAQNEVHRSRRMDRLHLVDDGRSDHPRLAGRRAQGSEAPTRRFLWKSARRRRPAARTVPPARTKPPSSWCDCPSTSIHRASPAAATIRASNTKRPGSAATRSISI